MSPSREPATITPCGPGARSVGPAAARRPAVLPTLTVVLASTLLLAPAPALALYKVVGADGSVTYTDRPPAASNARVTPLARGAATSADAAGEAGFPPELRQAVQRHPVTLYTTADCASCDNGRRLLQQRGVPYAEKRITSEDDVAALERIAGARSVPVLTIGSQPLRGFVPADWTSFLDAAGYPATSRLPRGWQPPPVAPLVARAAAQAPAAAAPAPAPAAAEEEPAPAEPNAVRLRF